VCITTDQIKAHHEDVEENGWDGPMPSRPALADSAQHRSLARSVLAHEDRAALLLTVDALQKRITDLEVAESIRTMRASE
jgi:hypothetical protein